MPQKECTGGLLGGAAAGLKVGGHLFVYGPFALNGLLIPDSNKDFDASLKARSGGSWGIRDAAWVCGLAYEQGLELTAMTPMPANNFFVVFTKVKATPVVVVLLTARRTATGLETVAGRSSTPTKLLREDGMPFVFVLQRRRFGGILHKVVRLSRISPLLLLSTVGSTQPDVTVQCNKARNVRV